MATQTGASLLAKAAHVLRFFAGMFVFIREVVNLPLRFGGLGLENEILHDTWGPFFVLVSARVTGIF